jgi:ATP-binding protein involved in chromosome partitioning
MFNDQTGTRSREAAHTKPFQESDVLNALRVVMDPDLQQDIVSLGFVKDLVIEESSISMTLELTTPACPIREEFRDQCRHILLSFPGITRADVKLTAQARAGAAFNSELLARSLGRVRYLVAVASGKGGVAKSTTAVNIAFALAREGARVGILDADIYGPSIPHMTGSGAATPGASGLMQPPEVEGIKIISMGSFVPPGQASIMRGPIVSGIIKQFLTEIDWGELDYLLIDYPPGTGDIQLTLSQVAPISGALIVTTPQEIALLDVRKAVSMFTTLKVPIIGIIETMSYFVCDGCDKKHSIFRGRGGKRLSEELGVPLLAEIPMDPQVADHADHGQPLVNALPGSPAGTAYRDAAGKAAQQLAILEHENQGALAQFTLGW